MEKKKYPLSKLFFTLILFEIILQLNSQTVPYYFPQLKLKSNWTKRYKSNFTRLAKFEVNHNILYQLFSNMTFVFTDVGAGAPYQYILFDSTNNVSYLRNQTLIDYGSILGSYTEIYFLVNSSNIVKFTAFGGLNFVYKSINSSIVYSNSIFQSTRNTFYIINPNTSNFSTAVLNRILRLDVIANASLTNQYPTPIVTNIQGSQVRASSCISGQRQFLAIWNISSFIQIYQCGVYTGCSKNGTIPNNFVPIGNSTLWPTDNINWNQPCSRLFVEADGYATAKTYNVSGSSLSSYLISSPWNNTAINNFQAMTQSSNQGSIYLSNGSLIQFSLLNNTFMNKYDYSGNKTPYGYYQYSRKMLFLNFEGRVQWYFLGCLSNLSYFTSNISKCIDCPVQCSACTANNSICSSCINSSYILSNLTKTCIFDNTSTISNNSTNSSNSTNSTTNNTLNNSTENNSTYNNSTNNNTTNSTSNTSLNYTQPNNSSVQQQASYPYGTIYEYQNKIIVPTIQTFKVIGEIIQKVFIIFQVLPLAWLFISFINFWSVCSFYALIQADIPHFLYLILKIIYDKINRQLFDVTDIARNVYYLPQTHNSLQQFGISASFIQMNLYSLILFIISVSLAILFKLFIQKCFKQSWIDRKLQKLMNIQQVVVKQFVSTISNYIMPFGLIVYHMKRQNFTQTVNLLLHIAFIVFALLFPFLIFKRYKKIKQLRKHQKKISQNKPKCDQKQYQNQRQRFGITNKIKQAQNNEFIQILQFIYQANCNTLIPFFIILDIKCLFFVFGTAFYSFGIWIAFHADKFQLNQVILSLYHLLFHVMYAIISLFGQYSLPLKHNLAIVCSLILILGAFHEILTLVFSIFYCIFTQIRAYCSQIQNQSVDQGINSQIIMNILTSMKIKFRKTNKQKTNKQRFSQQITKYSQNKKNTEFNAQNLPNQLCQSRIIDFNMRNEAIFQIQNKVSNIQFKNVKRIKVKMHQNKNQKKLLKINKNRYLNELYKESFDRKSLNSFEKTF